MIIRCKDMCKTYQYNSDILCFIHLASVVQNPSGPKASPSLTSAVAVVMLGTFSAPRLAPAAAAVLCCAAAQIINFILLG